MRTRTGRVTKYAVLAALLAGGYALAGVVSTWLLVPVAALAAVLASLLIVERAEVRRRELALAEELGAVRRVATVVAGDPKPAAVFQRVTEEVGRLFHAAGANVVRYEGGEAIVAGLWTARGEPLWPIGARFPLDGETVTALVHRSGRPQRVDAYERSAGGVVDDIRGAGYRSAVAAPVEVGGRLWGALVVASSAELLPDGAERRLCDFAELVAQALANAVAYEKLAASRARLVEASDHERRRLERNLHDGAQQRLVSLALKLRLADARLAGDPETARVLLRDAQAELGQALDELRELARGIHPAVLTDRGLRAALETLVATATAPVELVEVPDERLPEQVEAAAYYVVAEAVTNVAKYAQASEVTVSVRRANGIALVDVVDDGVGGADPGRGSGLRGLADRLEALNGVLRVESPPAGGTRVRAEIPVA
jgi:signal transduction histidine kinase